MPSKNQSLGDSQVEITEGRQRRREEGKWGRAGQALRGVHGALNKHAGAFSESQEFPKYNL